MGLYLCIFDGDEEIDGVEVGPYADFGNLRDYVVCNLEDGKHGSRYPTFILHSDGDGEWAAEECGKLRTELSQIIAEMKSRQAVPFGSDWQRDAAKRFGVHPQNAYESFVDVDGEFVLERLEHLAEVAHERNLPILFQ